MDPLPTDTTPVKPSHTPVDAAPSNDTGTPQASEHVHGPDCDHEHEAPPAPKAAPKAAPKLKVYVEETPNPNALKFSTDKVLSKAAKSWNSAAEAAGDPLGEALFALDGVAQVFMVNDFVSVTKSQNGSWSDLRDPIVAAIEEHATPEG